MQGVQFNSNRVVARLTIRSSRPARLSRGLQGVKSHGKPLANRPGGLALPLGLEWNFTLRHKCDTLPCMTALSKQQAFEIIGHLEAEIRALGVIRLAVFGSVVRGEARPESDVDILVQFQPGAKTFDRYMALSDLLESHLGRRVELITTEALSPFIGSHILAEAQDVIRAA